MGIFRAHRIDRAGQPCHPARRHDDDVALAVRRGDGLLRRLQRAVKIVDRGDADSDRPARAVTAGGGAGTERERSNQDGQAADHGNVVTSGVNRNAVFVPTENRHSQAHL